MSESCLSTQQLISMAYDGHPVSASDLQEAKAHCAGCADCTAYVSGLARLRAVSSPGVPADVIDRTLAAVREVRLRDAAKAATSAARAEVTGEPDIERDVPAARARWISWSGWAAAAAAVFLVIGIVTVQGVRYLTAPGELSGVASSSPTGEKTAVEEWGADAQRGVAPQPEATGTTAQDTYALSASSAPAYLVFKGFVYAVDDAPERVPASAETVGSLTTDLGSGTPAQRDVYSTEEWDRILIAVDGRKARSARMVSRIFDGTAYGLRSPDITVFGTWPSLPVGYPEPSSQSGTPEYDDAGTDSQDATVYVQPGRDPGAGFAIAPQTSASDPAAANPNWTWWAPIR